MKRAVIFSILLFMTGCSIYIEDNIEITEPVDPFINYRFNESIKYKLSDLISLWEDFDSSKLDTKDPTDDFQRSEYLIKLKEFLSDRESLNISISDLSQILGQNNLKDFTKKAVVDNNEFNIRVISYNVDYYVQAITDYVGLPNKWIFAQCWNEDEFYFNVISDGDIHTVDDFIPFELNGTLRIILMGSSFPSYPRPPFLWAWKLGDKGFEPSHLFKLNPIETKFYDVITDISFQEHIQRKWTFRTDSSFIAVEKRTSLEESKVMPSDYLWVSCNTDDEGKSFSFATQNHNDTIRLMLQGEKYIVVTSK